MQQRILTMKPLTDAERALLGRYATMIDDERVASYLLRLLAEHGVLLAYYRSTFADDPEDYERAQRRADKMFGGDHG